MSKWFVLLCHPCTHWSKQKYKVRHLYPRKSLLMFYNSFAKSVITCGIPLYGTTYKTNFSIIETVQRRILRAIFFKKKLESLEKVFADNKTLAEFELFMIEILRELFRQLKFESPRILIQPHRSRFNVPDKVAKKYLSALTYCRTVTNKKSLTNCLRKAYNWLKNMDLITFSLGKMSLRQIKQYLSKATSLYIVVNKKMELF